MDHVIAQLKEAGVGKVYPNEPMSNHTTWKIGGPADLLILPESPERLRLALEIIRGHGIPWTVIGRGSNLLVLDGGIRGAVFKLSEGFDHLEIDGTRVRVGAGYSFVKLAVQIGKLGLTGLEFAGGIPGTVGGAIYMNAGAHGSDVSRILQEATILWENGEIEAVPAEAMGFAYRTSLLQKRKGIVLEAVFSLREGDRKAIAAVMAANKDRRRVTQPLQEPCAGSVFRNPPGDYAGRLIEAAGLKGYRIGDAQVSEIHANFIVNRGKATARNVLDLIRYIQEEIYRRYQVKLETEVLVMGEG